MTHKHVADDTTLLLNRGGKGRIGCCQVTRVKVTRKIARGGELSAVLIGIAGGNLN